MIDQELVKTLFDYREDGFLIWKLPPTNRTRAGQIAGSFRKNGYSQTGINRKIYTNHRIIYLWHHGYLPKEIDHINRIRDDNRIENLRDACGHNQANRTKKKNTSSKYIGVTWEKNRKKWQVYCQEKLVGRFKTEKEAAIAYNLRAIKVFGSHAHLNSV